MKTSLFPRKRTKDHLPYFLAGQSVPKGDYREIRTGREIRMEEEGILPATHDGQVGVYCCRPQTWAELRRQKETAP